MVSPTNQFTEPLANATANPNAVTITPQNNILWIIPLVQTWHATSQNNQLKQLHRPNHPERFLFLS